MSMTWRGVMSRLAVVALVGASIAGGAPIPANAAAVAIRTVSAHAGVLSASTPTVNDTTPVVDQELKAETGAWGPGPVEFGYQWYRVSRSGRTTRIGGATGSSFEVRSVDVGYRIKVKVTGRAAGYAATAKTSARTSAVAKAQFAAAPTPTISGVGRVGMPFSVVPGGWQPSASLKYRWYRVTSKGKSTPIRKATKASYTATTSDRGRLLRVQVKGYRAGYVTLTRYSPVTSVVLPGMAGATPKINDTTPSVGQELTADERAWSPKPTTFSYQWYSKSPSGKVSRIAGATGRTHTVDGRFAGYKVKVRVTGHAPDFASVTRTSAYTSAVAKGVFTNKGTVTIRGNVQIGQTLTADEGDWRPTPSSFSYVWYRSGAAISGATRSTYTVVAKDKGTAITVRVTAKRTGYLPASRTSFAAAHVTSRVDPATAPSVQPAGMGAGWALVDSEEFGASIEVTNAAEGLIRFRDDGPDWATWYPDWQMFRDEYPTARNHTNTDEEGYYDTSKVTLSGSNLILAIDRKTTLSGWDYTAGMISTIPGDRDYTSGAFEIRSRVTGGGNGSWPAFWLSSAAENTWDEEIDIWEDYNDSHYDTNVYAADTGWWDGPQQRQDSSWHTYGCKWNTTGVYFYRDGSLTGYTENASYVPAGPLYVTINSGARTPASPTFESATVEVGYYRAWVAR